MRLALLLALLLLLGPRGDPLVSSPAGLLPVEVLEVVDGDTLRLRLLGRTETARLLGVSAPELPSPWGQEAKELLRRLLRPPLFASLDPLAGERDRYGRLLVYLWADLDGDGWLECLNALLVESPLIRAIRAYPYALRPHLLRRDR